MHCCPFVVIFFEILSQRMRMCSCSDISVARGPGKAKESKPHISLGGDAS